LIRNTIHVLTCVLLFTELSHLMLSCSVERALVLAECVAGS